MRNRNNEEFDVDDGLEETTVLTHIEPGAHPDILAELPGVELKQEQVTDVLDTTDPDTDPMASARAIENEYFDIPDMTSQCSQGNRTSEPQQNQDQDIEYNIIIENNKPSMEPNGPLVESDKNPFK